jgi:hypothetical protein
VEAYKDSSKIRPFGIYLARVDGAGPWKTAASTAAVHRFFTQGHVVLSHLSLDSGDVRPDSMLHEVYCITLKLGHWESRLPSLPCPTNMTG